MRCIAFVIYFAIGIASARGDGPQRPLPKLDTGGHMASIKGLAFTPDGKFLVSAGDDKVIRVWDWHWRAGKTVRTLRGQSGPGKEGKIYALALSPDGRWLAVGGWLGTSQPPVEKEAYQVRLYDLKSGAVVALLKGHRNMVNSVALSPDGKKLISGSTDRNAIIWDVETKTLLRRLEGHHAEIYSVGFTPDGARAVTGSYDNTLRLWNAANGALLKEMTGHSAKVQSLAISPRDGIIASGDFSGEIRLWDGKTGMLKKVFANQGGMVSSLRFSPDGRLLLSTTGYCTSCNATQHVWDVDTKREVSAYIKHDNTVIVGDFSPDGNFVATGGGEKNEIHIWDPKTGETKAVLKGTGRPSWAVGFSADGRSIAWGNSVGQGWSVNDYASLEWALHLPSPGESLSPPEPVKDQEGWVRAKARFGDLSLQHRKGGNYGYDSILDIVKDGNPTISIEREPTDGYGHRSYSFTPDGKTVISGGNNGVLLAYGLDGKKIGEFVGHEADVWAVAPSPDGRYLVSGANDQTVRLWDLKTRELLVTLFRGEDGEWVMWTSEGFYAGSKGGAKLVGWQINKGADNAAEYVTSAQLRDYLLRPDLVALKIAGDPKGLVKQEALRLNIEDILKGGAAPAIAIVSSADAAKGREAVVDGVLRVSVDVTARITDQGGGIGRIEWRAAGQVVSSKYGPGALAANGEITQHFDLAAPDTVIELVVENKKGKASPPASLHVLADEKALKGVPDLYILAVGVDHYRDVNKSLDFAVKDAAAIGDALVKAGKTFYRHEPKVILLPDEKVTEQALTEEFAKLKDAVKATDIFVFYMAGHGKTIDANYYFVPGNITDFSDASIKNQGFGPDKFRAWFANIPATKSIWIFDTCEAGSADAIFKPRGLSQDAAYQRLNLATGRAIFMASRATDEANEGFGDIRHGLFTYALLEGLAEAGDKENAEKKDMIWLSDLSDWVKGRVPELSRNLSTCHIINPDDYCQMPMVPLYGENYPFVRRYPEVLVELHTHGSDIPRRPTHVVLAASEVMGTRGESAGRVMARGEQVTAIKTESDRTQVAQDGKILGWVNTDNLLKLIGKTE